MEGSSEPLVSEDEQANHGSVPSARDSEGGDEGPSYTASHFTVLVKPVAITMVLATIVSTAIRTPQVEQSFGQGVSAYTVYGENAHDTSTEKLGKAVVNALVIVGGVIVMTFLMVLLYKFRCLKFLYGLLVFTTLNALSYTLGFILYLALFEYKVTVDWITFAFVIYNFGIVGVVAVFYQKGIPRRITQAYLIVISVVISYLLSFFPDWTAWTLLVVLAFYDLCAVLTPCGPLRVLIELAQTRQDPLPALLYEAEVGGGGRSARRGFPTSLGGEPQRESESRPPLPAQEAAATMELRAVDAHGADDRHPGGGYGDSEPSGDSSAGSDAETGGASHRRDRRRDAGGEMEFQYLDDEGDDSGDGGPDEASIKLGLGDFIFYSLLVSKAALYGFPTAVACFVAIIMGLMTTLTLLAIAQKALPALPFSMLLGVFFYLMVRLCIGEFSDDVTLAAVYF